MCVCLEVCAEMQHMAYRDTSLCVYVWRAIVFACIYFYITYIYICCENSKIEVIFTFYVDFFSQQGLMASSASSVKKQISVKSKVTVISLIQSQTTYCPIASLAARWPYSWITTILWSQLAGASSSVLDSLYSTRICRLEHISCGCLFHQQKLSAAFSGCLHQCECLVCDGKLVC